MMLWVEHVTANWDHWGLAFWLSGPMPESVLQRFHENQDAFDIRFLEDILARLGEDADILAQLGHLYTRAGRHRHGLAVDRRLAVLRPRDPTVHYNLACSYALLKQTGRAFAALKKAIKLGYRDVEHMQQDPDLENLRHGPQWNDLIGVLKS